jgi:hypothetical protein
VGKIITSKQQLQSTYRVNKMFTRTPFISQCESICHLFVVAQTKDDFLSIAKKTCFSVRYERDANVNLLHIYFTARDIKQAHTAFGSSRIRLNTNFKVKLQDVGVTLTKALKETPY